MDLVVWSLEVWDDVWRRNQHLISRLLTTDPELRVLFVEPPADPLHDLVSRRRPSWGSPLRAAGWEGRLLRLRPTKMLPRRLDPDADQRLARAVRTAAERAGMRTPVLWLNDPVAAPLARMTAWPTLYDITDDWVAADRPAAEIERVRSEEQWLLTHAQSVVACSPELVRRKSAIRAGGVELVPNAVDVTAYRTPQPRPADLPDASAVYVGTLHADRLDVDLCVAAATMLAGRGALVLVGPNALDIGQTERLRRAGALLLGPRRHGEVVGYLQHADLLIVPHAVTPFTDSLDPIKLYEYLAVGRPIVSTPVAGFRDSNTPRVRVVASSGFAAEVAAAVPAPAWTSDVAPSPVPGWDERAVAMRKIIDGMPRA